MLLANLTIQRVRRKEPFDTQGVAKFWYRDEDETMLTIRANDSNKFIYVFTLWLVKNGELKQVREVIGWGDEAHLRGAYRKALGRP